MANLTLAIDDELLQKARQQAVKERTSVNALSGTTSADTSTVAAVVSLP